MPRRILLALLLRRSAHLVVIQELLLAWWLLRNHFLIQHPPELRPLRCVVLHQEVVVPATVLDQLLQRVVSAFVVDVDAFAVEEIDFGLRLVGNIPLESHELLLEKCFCLPFVRDVGLSLVLADHLAEAVVEECAVWDLSYEAVAVVLDWIVGSSDTRYETAIVVFESLWLVDLVEVVVPIHLPNYLSDALSISERDRLSIGIPVSGERNAEADSVFG